MLALLAGAAAASAAYQAVAETRDRRRFPPPGRLIDIGGRRLHLLEAGEGTPPVIIVPALGDNVLLWAHVQEALARYTRVCLYDRAGIGWSDPPPPGRRTAADAASDLRQLLAAAGIAPPYVLVGHSLGGIIVRCFAARFPAAVAGMALIESSHEDQARRRNAAGWRGGPMAYRWLALKRQARILGMRRLAAHAGMLPGLDAMLAREVPAEFTTAAKAISLSSRQRRTLVQELLLIGRSRGQPPGLGSMPVTVVTAARQDDPVWMGLQADLATLSADSVQLVAATGGHYIHVDDPGLVIQAIRGLVNRCR